MLTRASPEIRIASMMLFDSARITLSSERKMIAKQDALGQIRSEIFYDF